MASIGDGDKREDEDTKTCYRDDNHEDHGNIGVLMLGAVVVGAKPENPAENDPGTCNNELEPEGPNEPACEASDAGFSTAKSER